MTASNLVLWVEMPGVLYELIALETAEGESVEEWLADPANLDLECDVRETLDRLEQRG